jgi:hypothetical protein
MCSNQTIHYSRLSLSFIIIISLHRQQCSMHQRSLISIFMFASDHGNVPAWPHDLRHRNQTLVVVLIPYPKTILASL